MNKIEKIKIAVHVALYYFIITNVLSLLSKILSDLLFKNSKLLVGDLSSNAPRYIVVIVVIILLAILSKVLKRRAQGDISIDSKPLLYIIVGLLLIVNGVINIPTQVSLTKFYINHLFSEGNLISQGTKTGLMDTIYRTIVPIVFYIFQIGIGAYFTLRITNRNKQV